MITVSATIAAGGSLSGVVSFPESIDDASLVGISMPATWVSAAVTFQTSADGATFQDLYNSAGTEVSVTAVQAHNIALDPTLFAGIRHLKVRSGTGTTPVVQTGGAVVKLTVIEL